MRQATQKQIAFANAMYTIGLDTFGNGQRSAEAAGYSGNDNTLRQTAHKLVTNGNVIKLKTVIQAKTVKKLDHNRAIAIALLNEALAMARKKKDNQGIVSATRELNAISNLHSSTLHTDSNEQAELDAKSTEEANRLANIRLRTG